MLCKEDVISLVASELGITKKTTREVINATIAAITQSLQDGEEIWLNGFGTFRVVERNPRTGRNPHTGEAIEIPARQTPTFFPSEDFKRKFNKL